MRRSKIRGLSATEATINHDCIEPVGRLSIARSPAPCQPVQRRGRLKTGATAPPNATIIQSSGRNLNRGWRFLDEGNQKGLRRCEDSDRTEAYRVSRIL